MLKVKNWEKFQHYQNRPDIKRVSWVKLHCELVHDFEFSALDDHLAIVLVLLWTAAAKNDGAIPADPVKLGFAIRRTVTLDDLRALVNAGFLTDEDASLENSRNSLEQIREGKGREEKRRERALVTVPVTDALHFEQVWASVPRKQGKAKALAAFIRWAKAKAVHPDEVVAYFLRGIQNYLAAPRFEGQEWKHGDTLVNEIAAGSWDEPVTEKPKGSEFPAWEISEWQKDPLSGTVVRTRDEAIAMLREHHREAN